MAKKINYPYGVKSIILENNGGGADGDVYLDGNSLVIPEQEWPLPEPVISIDGVTYYHKQEIAIDYETVASYSQGNVNTVSIVPKAHSKGNDYPRVEMSAGGPPGGFYARLALGSNVDSFTLAGAYIATPNYTSRAFTVVDTQEEVTDNTKICLPACSAYYGFLSEDGKTFISYYNLKSEAPEYVDSIKQGNDITPLKDMRVPEVLAEDYDKYLHVNADTGDLEYVKVGSGTRLYEHQVIINNYASFKFVSISGIPLTTSNVMVLMSSSLANLMFHGNVIAFDPPAGSTYFGYWEVFQSGTDLMVNRSSMGGEAGTSSKIDSLRDSVTEL